MMPDVEPVVVIEGTDADPAPVDASRATDVVEQTARETGRVEAIEAEASPDASAPPGSAAAGPSLPRVPGPHDRVRKIAAIAFIATVLLGAAAVTLTRSPYFAAHRIEVRGASHVTRSEVLRMAGIAPGTNVFTLDAGSAETRLERDPWIARATVTKDLPSRVVIDIDERVAVAVVGTGEALRLVADDGALLEAALPRTAAGLPTIEATEPGVQPGSDAIGGAARAIAAMAPSLRGRIHGVSILSDGQLRVDLSSGAEVAYGEAVDLSEKAMALRALLDYAAQKGAAVISADVRVPSAPTAVLSGGAVVAP
jgi:cell division protein FtsQ